MPGYPDWQRYPARIGGNLLSAGSLTLATGSHDYGPYAISSFNGISLAIEPSAGYGTVKVSWYESSAMTYLIKEDTFNVSADIWLVMTMPAFGPWVLLTIDVTSTASMTARASMRGTGSAGSRLEFPVVSNGVNVYSHTLAAGSTAIFLNPFIRSGLAYVTINPADTSGLVIYELIAVTPAGALDYHLARWPYPTADVTSLVAVPPVSTAMLASNGDASNPHTFDLWLTFGS